MPTCRRKAETVPTNSCWKLDKVGKPRAVVLKLELVSESPGKLGKTQDGWIPSPEILISTSRVGSKNLHLQVPRWCWCCWSLRSLWTPVSQCTVYGSKNYLCWRGIASIPCGRGGQSLLLAAVFVLSRLLRWYTRGPKPWSARFSVPLRTYHSAQCSPGVRW